MTQSVQTRFTQCAAIVAILAAVLLVTGCTVVRATGQTLVRVSEVGDRIADATLDRVLRQLPPP